MTAAQWWGQSDALLRASAVLLLAMSVASWVVIFWKVWFLQRACRDLPRAVAAFWQAPTAHEALVRLPTFDRLGLVVPLVQAVQEVAPPGASHALAASLATQGSQEQQLTRLLRSALHGVLARLQWGQVLLATVGATAPFVGLLGTVWGIYHALSTIAGAGSVSIERLAGPVGEALVMTAGGLAVAIPAVLAYNVLGRWAAHAEAELEGFARDVRELRLAQGVRG